ncbi:MAG: flagellar motor switch protein FliG [Halieaceae bacterium]
MSTAAQTDNANNPASGIQRAAQLLLVLGEDNAAQILRQLDQRAIQKLGAAMTEINEVKNDDVSLVLDHFVNQYESDNSIRVATDDYTRKVMIQALGEDEAVGVLSKISMGADTRALEALRWMEPELIAGMIKEEHPQIQAIVTSYLPPELAALVLAEMPEEAFLEIVVRMASLDSVDPMALSELNQSLQQQVDGVVSKQSAAIEGVKTVANILNAMDRDLEEKVIEGIRTIDEELADKVQEQMYVFEDLLKIPDRDFQVVLRELATDRLALAMKGAEEELKDKVFRNMSSRAADIFKDDMETLGPVKLSDVEEAQKEILEIIQRLSEGGEITLGAGSGDMVE